MKTVCKKEKASRSQPAGESTATPRRRAFVIAEMACSHEGDVKLARKIIDGAAQAGADAVQFQIWKLKELMVPHHPDYAGDSKLELSYEQWTELAEYVRRYHPSMQIIGCVYERESVDFCKKLGVDAFKLHSSDLSNPSMIQYVAATGKRIDLSVGASMLDEIKAAIHWIRETANPEIWLMYGYQNFPTRPENVNLRFMRTLKEQFKLPVGYQDHTDAADEAAFWLPAAALGMGVDIIEKHITHDRSAKGCDHEAALNPDEFAGFVRMVRCVESSLGVAEPRPFSQEELKYRKYSKKSIVAGRDLPAGAVLSERDLRFMRADHLGLPPDQSSCLIGRKTKRDIAAYHLILEEDVV